MNQLCNEVVEQVTRGSKERPINPSNDVEMQITNLRQPKVTFDTVIEMVNDKEVRRRAYLIKEPGEKKLIKGMRTVVVNHTTFSETQGHKPRVYPKVGKLVFHVKNLGTNDTTTEEHLKRNKYKTTYCFKDVNEHDIYWFRNMLIYKLKQQINNHDFCGVITNYSNNKPIYV